MTELIDKLVREAGLTQEQATRSLDVIKDFVKGKFPMLAGAVDNVFGGAAAEGDVLGAQADPTEAASGGSWFDKISDMIPKDMGEKIEEFAKKAAEAAGEAFDKAKDVAGDALDKAEVAFDKAKDVAGDAFDKAKHAAGEAYDKAKDKAEDLVAKAKEKLDDDDRKGDA